MPRDWKPVPGYGGQYEVSDDGRVRSRKWGRWRLLNTAQQTRYPRVRLCHNGRITNRYVHRLVAQLFLGPKPSPWTVNHINGDRKDNRVENLEWVTHSENAKHAARVLGKRRGWQSNAS